MVDHYITLIITAFESSENEQNAILMKKYMKDKFDFLGIRSPERRALTRPLLKEIGIVPRDQIIELVQKLWSLPEREYQYLAMDYLDKNKKTLVKEDVQTLQYLITTKSWWDTVDLLASKSVGHLLVTFPSLIEEFAMEWATSENLWLRRTAILFQLKYKEKTDQQLLFRIIKENASENGFFIRKGIGWALREYSKTNPADVVEFIHTQQLSTLSRREGLKHIMRVQKNKNEI